MVGRWNFLLIWSLFRGHSSIFGGVSSGKLTYIIETSSSTVRTSLSRVWVCHFASPFAFLVCCALSRLADRSPVSAVSARSALCDRAIADGLGGSQEAMAWIQHGHSSCKNPPQICIGFFVWSKKIVPNSTFIGFPDFDWGEDTHVETWSSKNPSGFKDQVHQLLQKTSTLVSSRHKVSETFPMKCLMKGYSSMKRYERSN